MKPFAVKTGAVILWAALCCGCAMQQDMVTIDDRLYAIERRSEETVQSRSQLETRLNEFLKTQEEKEQSLSERFAGQNVLIQSLREENRLISGRLEEIEYLLKNKMKSAGDLQDKERQWTERMEQRLGSNTERVARIEQYLNFETPEGEADSKAAAGKSPDALPDQKLSEKELYKLAKQNFDQGNFEAARDNFKSLIKQYPGSANTDNAQFWIGETYYREKWFEKAILEYQKVIEKYPKGNKVPSALLKQGFAFFNLGDKANARLILTELVKKYPKTNESNIARQKLAGLKP